MRTLVLTALAVLLLTAAPGQAVIGGQPDGDRHPYVVAVVVPSTGLLCSGALISATKLVTAAHCFAGDGDSALVGSGPNVLPFTSFGSARVHPDFCLGCGPGLPRLDTHDIAVVTLAVPVALGSGYAMLPEAGLADRLGARTKLTVVGYGVQGFLSAPRDQAGDVVPGRVPFSNFDRTTAVVDLVPSRHSWRDEFLRISASTAGICFGDSGGPNLIGDTIVAINAFANQACAGATYSYRLDTPAALAFVSGD